MSGLLCLKWNNHSPAFLQKLLWLREKVQYCDATIVCQNKYFAVHKLVLSTCSEYFEEIFEKAQCKHPFIIVKDIQPLELEALLNYMYKGEINVLQELLPGLLKAAESLQIKGLSVPDEDVQSDKYLDSSKSLEKRSSSITSPGLSKKIKNSNNIYKKSNSLKKITNEENLKNSEGVCGELCLHNFDNFNHEINNFKNSENAGFEKNKPTSVPLQTKDEPIEIQEQTGEISIKEGFDCFHDVEQLHIIENSKENEDTNPIEDIQEDHPQCSTWDDVIPLPDELGQSNLDIMQDGISGRNMSTICEMNMFETSEELCSIMSDVPASETELEKERTVQKKAGVKCPLCSHIATKPCKLKLHMYKHSGEKPFSCPHCTYTARTRYHVTVHLRKHTGEKPFECDYCSYKASNKANISRHMRIHSNDKPYQCPQCPYAATQASHLQDHMRQHYD